jgi:hypothetical protein
VWHTLLIGGGWFVWFGEFCSTLGGFWCVAVGWTSHVTLYSRRLVIGRVSEGCGCLISWVDLICVVVREMEVV